MVGGLAHADGVGVGLQRRSDRLRWSPSLPDAPTE
jgi:hypothetical protein